MPSSVAEMRSKVLAQFKACGQVEASVGLSSSNGNGIGNMTRPPTLETLNLGLKPVPLVSMAEEFGPYKMAMNGRLLLFV
ncbi:hypothetical protein TIFTF001_011319 [Ficus carica]|uniref:Uncharacterized protein n=1 Tax=Ficus carica TaxID=3494 RepID=A0AA87ZWZ7_FICCA|nr:hypothetical protein TIFTF001_011319 [Ficus carica]